MPCNQLMVLLCSGAEQMRINCGPTPKERVKKLKQWHPFFALWPRRVGPNDCRWLETIERKGEFWAIEMYSGWNWEYRARE